MTLLVLLACTGSPGGDDTAAELADLSEWGPLPVASFESSTESDGVEIGVQVWYPAAAEGSSRHEYAELWASEHAQDAADAACEQSRPVMVFSHGNSGVAFQSYFLTEFMASHGWVVVAPSHTHNTFFDQDYDRLGELAFRRPLDVVAAYEHALGLDALSGCIDESEGYAMAGHSFGGYTTVAVAGAPIDLEAIAAGCESFDGWLCDDVLDHASEQGLEGVHDLADPRVWAAIPMAPAGMEILGPGLEQVGVPTLVLGAELDTSTPMSTQVEPIHQGMTGSPRYLGELLGGQHYSFSNACQLVESDSYCPTQDQLSDEDAHWITRTLVVAFLEGLRGRDDAEDWLPPDADELIWTAD